MEKHQQVCSPANPMPAVRMSDSRPDGRKKSKDKPSRDEIALCINIWATVYRLRDTEAAELDAARLSMPSRTWTGRRAPSAERFE